MKNTKVQVRFETIKAATGFILYVHVDAPADLDIPRDIVSGWCAEVEALDDLLAATITTLQQYGEVKEVSRT